MNPIKRHPLRHPVTEITMSDLVTIILTIIFAGFGLHSFYRCECECTFFVAKSRHLRHLAAPPFNIKPFRGDARCHLLLPIVTKSNHKLLNVTTHVTLTNKGLAPKSDQGDVLRRLSAFSALFAGNGAPEQGYYFSHSLYRLRCSRRGNGQGYHVCLALYMLTHVLIYSSASGWFRVPTATPPRPPNCLCVNLLACSNSISGTKLVTAPFV